MFLNRPFLNMSIYKFRLCIKLANTIQLDRLKNAIIIKFIYKLNLSFKLKISAVLYVSIHDKSLQQVLTVA